MQRNELLYSAHDLMQWISADWNASGKSSQDTALNNMKTIAKWQGFHVLQYKAYWIDFHNSCKNVSIFHFFFSSSVHSSETQNRLCVITLQMLNEFQPHFRVSFISMKDIQWIPFEHISLRFDFVSHSANFKVVHS